MVLYATAALFSFISALMLAGGSSLPTVPANVSSSCEPYQTECTFGCCPFAEAVCCADGFECCQHGQTCIPIIGICIGVSSVAGQASFSSSKPVPVTGSFATCPPDMTECGKDKCCRFPQATCCSDGEHCCPQGYSCDLISKTCNKASNTLISSWTRKMPSAAAKEGEWPECCYTIFGYGCCTEFFPICTFLGCI